MSSFFSRFAVCNLSRKVLLRVARYLPSRVPTDFREIKLDVTWSHVKQQTAKITSEFVFFSSNPSLNHLKIEKCFLLFSCSFILFFMKRWACSTLPCTILECFVCRFKLNIVPRICICRIQQGHVHSVPLYPLELACMDKLCVVQFWCTFKLHESTKDVIPSFVPPLDPALEILPLLAFCDKVF